MSRVALGFRVHTGWAAAVALAAPPRSPSVIDRRRLELRDPAMPLQVYHAARPLGAQEAVELIRRATEATGAMAERSLRALVGDLRASGHEILGAGVVLGSSWPPATEAKLSHAGAHAAEGQMHREALIRASEACGLPVTGVAERSLYTQAAKVLRMPVEDVQRRVADLGREPGPPWGRDQKDAALVAWLALAERTA